MKKLIISFLLLFILVGCVNKTVDTPQENEVEKEPVVKEVKKESVDELVKKLQGKSTVKESLEGEIFYNIFPISYADSNGDGKGDLNGITASLDYLKELGVKGIWLNPIHPSPSYHKYDVTDYYEIDKEFGTINDFKKLLEEAHKRDMVIIMDIVFNHSSSKHPWFDKAMTDEAGFEDFYIKVNSKEEIPVKVKDAWYPYKGKWYFGSFWSEMPEFNLESENVRNEMKKILKHWLDLGVDGFRYDAAKHAYDNNEYKAGTPTLDKNRQFWLEMKDYVKTIKPDAYLVAEVWMEAKQMSYYAHGFDALFNFDFGTGLIKSLQSGQGINFQQPYAQFRSIFKEFDEYLDAPFISNHDQPRVGSLLNGDENLLKMAASVLLTIPGNPYIYYGEELGYKGVKPDERIREPFKWGDNYTQKQPTWENLQYNTKTASVSEQLVNENSILNHYKALGKVRSENEVLKKGDYKSLPLGSNEIIAYERSYNNQTLYVIHNIRESEQRFNIESSGEVIFSLNGSSLNKQEVVMKGYSTLILQVKK